ncbi:unnamed protein product [Closterium sp. NIES-65]|nr:unnamed protein product [Closterium sp. NIES-65]
MSGLGVPAAAGTGGGAGVGRAGDQGGSAAAAMETSAPATVADITEQFRRTHTSGGGAAAAGAAGAGAGAATDPALLSRVAEIRDAIQAETVPPEFTALIETESAVLAADLRAVVKTERGLAKTRKQFFEGQVAHCIPKNFVPELHLHTTEAQEQLRTRMQELQQHAQGQMQLILISGQVEDLQQLQTRVTTWRDRLLVTIDDRLARACDVGFLAQQFAAEPARSAIWQSIQTLRVRCHAAVTDALLRVGLQHRQYADTESRRVEQQQRQRERRQERREQAEATPVDQTMGEFVPREVERQVGAWQDEAREQLRRILERLDRLEGRRSGQSGQQQRGRTRTREVTGDGRLESVSPVRSRTPQGRQGSRSQPTQGAGAQTAGSLVPSLFWRTCAAAVLPAAFFGAFFPAAAVWSTPPAAAVWSTSSDPPTAPPATAASTGSGGAAGAGEAVEGVVGEEVGLRRRSRPRRRLEESDTDRLLRLFARRSVQEVADKLTNVAVHNLSRRQLSEDELAGLALGLKFIPTPPSLDQEQLRQAVEQFQRRVRLAWQFRDSRRPVPRFRVPRPSWQPSSGPEEVEEYLAGVADRVEGLSELIGGPARPNVSRRVLGALQRLSRDRSIVIKPADKNLGIAVLDREWYEGEALRQLGDRAVYEPVAMVPLQGLWGQLCRWAEQARLAGLPSQVLDFILQPRTPCLKRATRAWERFRVCRFYLLPKLHKTPVAGRPICSSTLWVFEHASAVLDHYLRPLLRFSPSHLPDSLALLHQLEDLRVPAEALFLTYDVESLYPSIPIDAGISCIERWLLRWAAQERISGGVADTLVQLLGLVMRQNHLEFGGRFWRQVRGTAMGTPVAVIYAVLFMAWLDERLLETEPELSQHVLLHRRFIDDGVVVWTGTRERLLEWVGAFGGLEQTIRLTHEISTSQFTLLDITFSKGELWQTTAILDTTTFQKPLNVYQYFPFSSAHPSHCKRGFILGELQRYILRESSSRGFRSIRSAFYARLRARRYPDTFLQPIFSSISYARRPELLARSRARGEGEQEAQQRVLPLVLDFHPSVQQVRWGRLLAFPPEAPAFEQLSHYRAPFVSYRAPPSLRQLLVRASFR